MTYWVEFCDLTGYLAIKGRHKGDASLDCRLNELGYIDGNLRLMTVEDNASKGIKYPEWDWQNQCWVIVTWASSDEFLEKEDLPF